MLVNLPRSPQQLVFLCDMPGAAQLRWQHEQSGGAVDGKSRSIGVVAPGVKSLYWTGNGLFIFEKHDKNKNILLGGMEAQDLMVSDVSDVSD